MSGTETTKISYAQALGEAIRMEMHRDSAVVCVGAGPAVTRSPVTENLTGIFGADRVVELESQARPLSVAAGMASRGLRVICEARAAQLGPDALAPLAELPGGEGSVVLRVPDGGGELPRDELAAVEGMLFDGGRTRLLAPATPADAKGMLAGSIRAPGSSCLIEPEQLYATVGDVPEGAHLVAAGEAAVEVFGRHPRLSVLSYGVGARLAGRALEIAGVDAELLDLRTLLPLDREAIVSSAGRTGKVVVLEPAGATRVGAEVAAVLLEEAFEYLDGPLGRVELDPVTAVEGESGEAAAAAIAKRIDELVSY